MSVVTRESTAPWNAIQDRWLVVRIAVALVSVCLAMFATGQSHTVAGTPTIRMPFGPGQGWIVSQGYNTSPDDGGTHWNCDPSSLRDEVRQSVPCRIGWQYKYSLDFRSVTGSGAGETVIAPVDGTIRWVDHASGGVSINLGNGYAVAIFHTALSPGLAAGQPVVMGQPLGTVAAAGEAGNGDTPHLHLVVWKTEDGGNWSRKSVPFTGPLALDGYDFPDLGDETHNQHSTTIVYSSNAEIPIGEDGIPAAPAPTEPVDGSTVTSPVSFGWSGVDGAEAYQVVVDGTTFGDWTSDSTTTMSLSPGDHTWQVRARNETGTGTLSPSRTLTVSGDAANGAPTITTSRTSGEVGDVVSLGGTGFAPGEAVTIAWRGAEVSTLTASGTGSLSTQFTLPPSPQGSWKVDATGVEGTNASAEIEIVPSLEREPVRAAPGMPVSITANGFAPNEKVELHWQSIDGPEFGAISTDRNGSGTVTIELPDAATSWTDYTGFGTTSRARAWGAIDIRPVVTLDETTADPGDRVTVTGRGFPADSSMSVRIDATSDSTGTELCAIETDASGRASCEITVPDRDAGGYTISMVAGDDTNTSETLAISGPPAVSASPDKTAAGTEVEVRVGGFEPGETVTISFEDGEVWRTVKTDEHGTARIEGTVPNVASGKTSLRASSEDSSTDASSPFTVASTAEFGQTSMTGTGTYTVVATREGLVGGTTSNGHVIVENDHFVSLPACTATSCPWHDPGEQHEDWGLRTECGDKCYVKVINEHTQACEVAPIWDTGPWFTVDDWWRPGPDRHLNKLRSNPNYLAQGVTGASAARDGLDVGYGRGPDGIGSSNRYTSVGNASAIDLADGTWTALGLDFNKGIDVIDVELLWQTGGNPAAEATRCGHPLDQTADSDKLTLSDSTVEVGSSVHVDGSGFARGESVTIHMDSPSGPRLGTTTASNSGAISKAVRIPDAHLGSHTIVAIGQSSGSRKHGTVTINPSIERSPTQGAPGTPVTLSVHGFATNEVVRITWDNADGSLISRIRTNEHGTGSTTVAVPDRTRGWNTYYARGETSNAGAYGAFEITSDGSASYPPGDSNTSFAGNRLAPQSSYGSRNGSGSWRTWDRNFGSSWYTVSRNPVSGGFTIDFGDVYQLTGVRWQLRLPGEADSFVVETSTDGRSWNHIGTYGNAPVSIWYGEDLNRRGRYLRVTFGNPNGDARIGGMTEVELWGRSAPEPEPPPAPAGSNPTFPGDELKVASSTSSWGTSTSTRAHDGSYGTSWYTTTANPSQASLTLDLGAVRNVSGVRWTFRLQGGADALTLLTSQDGVNWISAGTSSNRKPLTWEGLPVDRDARYIRLQFGNPYDAEALGYVAEVDVFGSSVDRGETNPPGDVNTSFSGSRIDIQGSHGSSNGSGSTRAWDRNAGSSWYTVTSDPSWGYFQVDLGEVYDLTGVRWTFRMSGHADAMLVQTTIDGSSWDTVGTYGNAPADAWRGENLNRRGRYVRFVFSNPNGDNMLGVVSEIEVWGDTGEEPPSGSTPLPGSNPLFSGTVLPVASVSDSASPSGQQTSGPERAVDASQGTSWYTVGGDPQQAIIQLDLGESRSVSGVKWMYRLSGGVDQQILQVSQNGNDWTQLVITSARQPNQWEGFGVDRNVRYVRIILTNNTDLPVLGYISEIQVWGAGADETHPVGDVNTNFSGQKLEPSWSMGSNNGSGSRRAWDGSLGTSWYTVNANPTGGYFMLAYPSVHQLTGVRWNFRLDGGGDAMRVETSVDGERWTLVGVYGNGDPGAWYGEDLNRQGRYVRFLFTNPNDDPVVGYVAEVELWGEPGARSTVFQAAEASTVEAPDNSCSPDASTTPVPELGEATPVATAAAQVPCAPDAPLATPVAATPAPADPEPAASSTTSATPLPVTEPDQSDITGTPAALATPVSDGTGGAKTETTDPAKSDATETAESPDVESTPVPVEASVPTVTDPPDTAATPTPISTATDAAAGRIEPMPTEAVTMSSATPEPISTVTPTPTNEPEEIATKPEAESSVDAPVPDAGVLATPTIPMEATTEAEPTFAPTPTVIPTEPAEPWTGYVVATDGEPLNCREHSSSSAPILGQLEPGAEVTVTGSPVDSWLPVECGEVPAWVSADYISDMPAAEAPETPPTETPTAPVPTEDPTEPEPDLPDEPADSEPPAETPTATYPAEPAEPTVEALPTPTPTPESVLVTREIVIPVTTDLSVSATNGGTEEPVGGATLTIGGEDQHIAAMTFDITELGDGTITSASLVVNGAGDTAASPGEVRIVTGYGIDPWSTTSAALGQSGAYPAGWLDWIAPGSQAQVDLTGWIPNDGTVTIVIPGDVDETAILSQESGSPPVLILSVEEWVVPET